MVPIVYLASTRFLWYKNYLDIVILNFVSTIEYDFVLSWYLLLKLVALSSAESCIIVLAAYNTYNILPSESIKKFKIFCHWIKFCAFASYAR